MEKKTGQVRLELAHQRGSVQIKDIHALYCKTQPTTTGFANYNHSVTMYFAVIFFYVHLWPIWTANCLTKYLKMYHKAALSFDCADSQHKGVFFILGYNTNRIACDRVTVKRAVMMKQLHRKNHQKPWLKSRVGGQAVRCWTCKTN